MNKLEEGIREFALKSGAGLTGKEARPLYIGNPGYLLSVIAPKKKKKR